MAYQPSLSDLGIDSSAQSNYQPSLGDLGVSSSGEDTQTDSQNKSTVVDKTLSALKSILPTPSLPLGVNVAMGALASPMPSSQRNLVEAAPNIAFGENYGTPQKIASTIGETVPSLMSGGPNLYSQALSGFGMGAVQAPEGQKMQGGLQNALTSTLLGKTIPFFGKMAGNALLPATSKEMATNIQAIHDSINNEASQGFQSVSQSVNQRGISQVPLPISVMNDLSNAVKSGYFPNTKQVNNLLNDAQSGDYNALRDMQSELWKKGTKAASSDSIVDNNKADEIFDLRDRINRSISNHLLNTGNEDLSSILDNSRKNYKYLQDTFYNKNMSPQIKKMVNPDIRQTPKNLGDLIQNDSVPMQNLRNAISNPPENNWLGKNPFTYNSDINSYNVSKGVKPLLKGLGIGGFGAGEAAALYKLYNPTQNHIE